MRENSMNSNPSFRGLTHRVGLVLTALHAPSGTIAADQRTDWFEDARRWAGSEDRVADDQPRELVLGIDNARAVARTILARADAYNAAIRGAIEGVDSTCKVTFATEHPAIRFAPGIIIDFAAFEVWRGDLLLARGRACATVCLHESQSKLWARFTQAAEEVGTRDFLNMTNAWFEQVAKQVADQYEHDIETVLQQAGRSAAALDLEARHKIEIISADQPGPALNALAEAIDTKTPLVNMPQAAAAAGAIDKLVALIHPSETIPQVAALHESMSTGRAAGDGNTYLIAHKTVRGNFGVYLARAKGWHIVIAGLAGHDDQPLIETIEADERDSVSRAVPLHRPASANVTADLANTVAGRF